MDLQDTPRPSEPIKKHKSHHRLSQYDLLLRVAKESGSASKVFLALQAHADREGYCWVLSSTLERETRLNRKSVFLALRRLEDERILDRRQLQSRQGRNAPCLFRLGARIEKLPSRAADNYYLCSPRSAGVAREKRSIEGRSTKKRYVGDVPKNGTGVVPKSGTGVVPKNGTQKYSIELSPPNGVVTNVDEVEELSLNTTDAAKISAAFRAFGFREVFGHEQFQRVIARDAPKVTPDNILEVMEAIYAAKHQLERLITNGRNANGRESFHEKRSRANAEAIARVLPDGVSALVDPLRRTLSAADVRDIRRLLPGDVVGS
jgi:hypothetical protein